MPNEFNNKGTTVGEGFFPSEMPEGLDLVIADPGCARYQMLGYRRAGDVYHQAWPPTKLPVGLFDAEPSNRQEALARFATTQNESIETKVLAEMSEIKTMLVSRGAQSKKAKRPKSQPACPDAATAPRSTVVIDDCEELVMLLAKRNPDVPKMSARQIETAMIKEFGKENSFTYRTIGETVLYKMWRKELKRARLDVGIDDLSDALDTGLSIASGKHGAINRRKDYSPKQEAAIRKWRKEAQNAAAEASHRVADRKKRR